MLAARPALITRNGVIRDLDGDPYVNFPGLSPGSYRLAIRHRNHLAIMTGSNRSLSNDPSTVVNLRGTGGGALYGGADATQVVGGLRALWPGDANFNGVVSYTGAGNDRDVILQAVGGSTPSNVVVGAYSGADVNLEGEIRYTGDNNDRDIILQTIGGVIPTAVKLAQMP